MQFVETPVFTQCVTDLIYDEDYQTLQLMLFARPTAGALIPHGGGLRKLRWSLPGMGKRKGCRIIYFWDDSSATFYMLFAYAKNQKTDLSPQQLRVLSRLAREEFK
jgi:hypothetical protein